MTSRLKGLRAENYKRLTLVDLTFPETGGVFALQGGNEAGKSSTLDAVESIIAGRKAEKFETPVHTGADSARIIATFDDIVVERKYKATGQTTIEVKALDGARYTSSEAVLQKLYSHVALDPLAFSRLKPEEQVATLLPLIGYDPAQDDAEIARLTAQRLEVGRDRDTFKGEFLALPDAPVGLPADGVDQVALSEEMAVALGKNAEIDQMAERVENKTREALAAVGLVNQWHAEIERLETALAAAKSELGFAREESAAVDAELEVLAAQQESAVREDVDAIRERIANARTINEAVATQKAKVAAKAKWDGKVDEWTFLDGQIAGVKSKKAAALATANMPVPKLTIDPETNLLMLDGVPFSQASTGVKIRTGVAIAMALGGDLKLIIIRDASLLDAGNRDTIDRLAKDNGYLILMELADTSQPIGVVFEDGHVAEVRS